MPHRRQFVVLLGMFPTIHLAAVESQPVARVSVLADGKLLLNGASTTIQELDTEFKKLKNANGVVWYYRQGSQSDPTPQAMTVIQLVVDHSLPVSMSSKPDFSDYVDSNGHSRPRGRK